MKYFLSAVVTLAVVSVAAQTRPPERTSAGGRPLKGLFLGHDQERPHPTPALYHLLASPLARRGIQLTHVNTPAEALSAQKLAHYDALLIFGNHKSIAPEQEKASRGRGCAPRAGDACSTLRTVTTHARGETRTSTSWWKTALSGRCTTRR